ncbi:MAG: CPBP family intramembrane metalloprotease [Dehalococcoidia bacterium]|nr:CPBP family intramembrane metalloprotease [Dehalococcoidia bacterium]
MPETFPSLVPQKRVWGFWPTIGLSVAILVIHTATQALVSLIAFVTKWYTSGLDFQESLDMLATDGLAFSLAIITAALLGLLLMVIFIKIRGNIPVGDYLGFKSISWRTILLLTLLVSTILATILIIGNCLGDNGDADFSAEIYRNSGFLPLLWLATIFFAPIFEELFFRGFLFVGLRASRLGPTATVVLTSLLWAALHIQYSLFGIIQILAMGLVLGTVRHKTDSIWSPLLIHILWNSAAILSTALYVSSSG